ncbi:MAG: potassium channel protein [Candidatus Poribacteria bacterium]
MRRFTNRFVRRELPVLAAAASLVAIGVGGYHQLEDMSLLDALYMTVITISTVGYEEIHPLSPAGRTSTIFIIIAGAAVAAYFLGVASQFFLDGEWRAQLERRWRVKMLSKLRDHVIVCGYGRVGRHVASELAREGLSCVIVGPSEKAVEAIQQEEYPCIQGDATDEGVLTSAGIDRARALISAASADADNVFITLTARSMEAGLKIVARANTQESQAKLRKAGADEVITPYPLSAHRMVAAITQPEVADFVDNVMREGHLELERIALAADSPLVGKKLAEADLRNAAGVIVIGIHDPQQGLVMVPQADMVFAEGCGMIVLGTREDLARFHRLTDA